MDTLDYKEIIRKLSEREFVIFAGAGLSKPTQIPDWKDLLKELEKNKNIQGVDVEELQSFYYPEAAQMFFLTFMQENEPDNFYSIIENVLRSRCNKHTTTQLHAFGASGKIITTNFDITFEDAFDSYKLYSKLEDELYTQTFPDISREITKKKNWVSYIHGKVTNKDIVFCSNDYEINYPWTTRNESKSKLEEFLSYIWEYYPIVFIGFSFEDRYLNSFFKKIALEVKPLSPKYVFLAEYIPKQSDFIDGTYDPADLEDSERQQFLEEIQKAKNKEEELADYGIATLWYENELHKEVEEFLYEIVNNKSASPSVVTLNEEGKMDV